MSEQIPLQLPLRPARGRDSFFVAPSNAAALAAVEGWRNWPGGKLVLIGPEGAGKTHLAHVWAEDTGAEIVPAPRLAALPLPELAAIGAVVVEDGETLGQAPEGRRAAEEALFHLHNLLAEGGGRLMLTARCPVRDWGLGLPDLHSRLSAAPAVRIDLPDEALLQAILIKLFADRQLAVAPGLIGWLVMRMPRTPAAAGKLVEMLDTRALAEGRAVTRTMAQAALAALEADAEAREAQAGD